MTSLLHGDTGMRLAPTALISIALTASVFAATAASAATDAARIVVTGAAEVKTAPDRASFTANVNNSGRDADAVLAANAQASEAMLAALRAAGIEITRLQTRSVRLDPQWSPRPRNAEPDWRPRIIGYSASNRVEVTTPDLAGIGALLAAAAEAGANGVDGVRFELSDDREARDAAIREATEDALAEARVMASAAGLSLGDVLELRLDHAHTNLPQPMMHARMEMAAMDSSPRAMPVAPGEITVTASVTVTLSGRP